MTVRRIMILGLAVFLTLLPFAFLSGVTTVFGPVSVLTLHPGIHAGEFAVGVPFESNQWVPVERVKPYLRQLVLSAGGVCWYRLTLPPSTLPSPAVQIWQDGILEARVDGAPIYRYGSKDVQNPSRWHTISLPPADQGLTLYLRLESSIPGETTALNEELRFGTQASLVLDRLLSGSLYLVFGLLLTFCGTIAFLFFFLNRFQHSLLFVGLLAVCFAAVMAGMASIPELLNPSPVSWGIFTAAVLCLIPVALNGFFESAFVKSAGLRLFSAASFVFFLLIASLSILSATVLHNPLFVKNAGFCLLLGFIITAAGNTAWLIVKGLRLSDRADARTLRLGVGLLAIPLMFDLVRVIASVFGFRLPDGFPAVSPFGMLAFVLTLGVIGYRQFIRSQQRLYSVDQEMALAREMQFSLLPSGTPVTSGLSVAALYEPMQSVGGDFYDFHEISPHQLGILVADVSGHGVPAAFVSAMVKVAFSYEKTHDAWVTGVLEGINRTLYDQLQREFVTAAYLMVDTKERKAWYTSAGHPPLYVWKAAEERVVQVKPAGKVIGVFPEIGCSPEVIDLAPGDRLLMVTDGVLEAESPGGGEYGDHTLPEFLRWNPELRSGEFLEKLLQGIREYRKPWKHFRDDVTLVVVDILPRKTEK